MKRALFIVTMLALIIGVTFAWADDPMRPGCDSELGACFFEWPEGCCASLVIVDEDGDAFQGSIDGINDFTLTLPTGEEQLHWQASNTTIFACRAGDFPACAGPGNPGLLVGSGNVLSSGSIENPGLFVRCPFTTMASGSVTDIHTGEEYNITVTWLLGKAPGSDNCEIKTREVRIRPAN